MPKWNIGGLEEALGADKSLINVYQLEMGRKRNTASAAPARAIASTLVDAYDFSSGLLTTLPVRIGARSDGQRSGGADLPRSNLRRNRRSQPTLQRRLRVRSGPTQRFGRRL